MGTDIHGRVQVRHSKTEGYEDEGPMEDTRSYMTFAMLANVRNGYGFAGIYIHDPIQAISEPRGIPSDLKLYVDCLVVDEQEFWMGDHSHSWLYLSEILNWEGWDKLVETGHGNPIMFRDHIPTFRAWVDFLECKYAWLLKEDPEAVRLVFGFDS